MSFFNRKSSSLLAGEPVVLAWCMLLLSLAILIGGPIVGILYGLGGFAREAPALATASVPARTWPKLDLQQVARGRRLYESACTACHGIDARGLKNLGRDLVDGAYSRTTPDPALVAMIIRGRSPGDFGFKGPVPMPARGGRPDFSNQDIQDIVAYLRALQRPDRIDSAEIPEVYVETLDGPADAVAAAAPVQPADAGSSDSVVFDPEQLKRGKRVFASCIACHGRDGTGMRGMGANLMESKFIATRSDDELLDFIKNGRTPDSPESVMKLNMPPKGGNPALKDEQIRDVIAYIRSMRQSAGTK